MEEFLQKFRDKIEPCWSDKTVSPKFLPLDTTKPLSLGQCAPTSQVLMDELKIEYPDINVTLAIGEVRRNGEIIIPYHVWLVQIFDSPKDNKVIDVTGDQSEVLTKVMYKHVKALANEGVAYISYEQSHDKRFIHPEAHGRYMLLKQNYQG